MLLLSFPLFVHFSFSPIKHFITEFSAPMRARVFKFCIHLERGQVYYGKKPKMLWLFFAFFFHLSFFSFSHSNVIHREICVKDFSGTTVPRILKFGTSVGYDLLYCVKENQHAGAYYSLICPLFFLSKQIFCYIFLSFYESQSSNFVYTLRMAKYIVWQKTKLRFILPSFSFFPSLTPM